MRLLEEEEQELLRREQDIERELAQKRKLREEKLKHIQSAMQSSQERTKEKKGKKKEDDEPEQEEIEELENDSAEDLLYFCLNVSASARRIKGTVYNGVFSGKSGIEILLQIQPSRREAASLGQRMLDSGLFWPISGDSDDFVDSERLYNLEDSHEIVIQARDELAYTQPNQTQLSAPPVLNVSRFSSSLSFSFLLLLTRTLRGRGLKT